MILVGLYVAQTIAAPIPGQALNFAAGYIFGLGPGLLYSWIGLSLGTTLAILLARYAGRPLVRRLVKAQTLEKLDRLAAGRGLLFFLLVFLLPGLPDDVACFVAGLTSLPVPALIAVSAFGRLPSLITAVWLGAYAERLPWQGWAILGLLAAGAALSIWRYGERIQDVLLGRLAKRS